MGGARLVFDYCRVSTWFMEVFFNIKMGGVGLGFGLIIAGFQHGFLCNFGSGESGFLVILPQG